jgi:aryl-alcohol dehydrogenase-like predicted oxidoreductase
MKPEENTLGRRSFLVSSAAGIAAGGIMAPLGKHGLLAAEMAALPTPATKTDGPVVTRTLGRTGIQLPIVSMGVMNASLPDLVKRSFELGVRHFDTAAGYQRGRNEEMVGNVVKQNNLRDKVTISTKIHVTPPDGTQDPAKVRDQFVKTAEESLKRLQMDHVDILYQHAVNKVDEIHNTGVREAMKLLQKQGKVRFIGFSTHQNMAELITDATKEDFWDVILSSFNFALSDDEKLMAAMRAASAKRIGLVAMKTQASHDWYFKDLPEEIQKQYKDVSIHPAMLKWALQHPFITTAIPGYTNFQLME